MSSGIRVQSRPERIPTLYFIVTRALVHSQLSSLAFIPGLWPDFLYDDFLKFFVWLRLAFFGQAFRITFYVLTGITSSVFVLTSLQMIIGFDFCPGLTDEFIWAFFMDAISFGFLMIPVASLSFEAFNCQNVGGKEVLYRLNSMQCWKGEHFAFVLLGLVSLVMISIALIARSLMKTNNAQDARNPTRLRSQTKKCDAFSFLLVLAVCLLAVYVSTTGRGYQVFASIATTCLLTGLLFYTFAQLPHVLLSYNILRTSGLSAASWIFFCLFISVSSKNRAVLLIGVLVVIPVSAFLTGVQNRRNPPSDEDLFPPDIDEGNDLENIHPRRPDDVPEIQKYCKRFNHDTSGVAYLDVSLVSDSAHVLVQESRRL